jgi:hypothetical protein
MADILRFMIGPIVVAPSPWHAVNSAAAQRRPPAGAVEFRAPLGRAELEYMIPAICQYYDFVTGAGAVASRSARITIFSR